MKQKGRDSCVDCSPGKHQDAPNSQVCKLCQAGTYRQEEEVEEDGEDDDDSSGTMLIMSTSNSNSTTSGNGTSGNGTTDELSAVVTRVIGSTCFDCPTGWSTNGGVGASSCSLCAAGKRGVAGRTETIEANEIIRIGSTCASCSIGQFRPKTVNESNPTVVELNPVTCFNCPTGYITTTTGSSECIICGAGRAGVGCQICAVGQYRESSTSPPEACSSCPAGFSQKNTGSSSCLHCIPGASNGVANALKCNFCAVNTFAKEINSTACKTCEIGRTTNGATGATSCTICSAGKFGAGEECTLCGYGQYRNGGDDGTTDATTCTLCPTGYHQDTKGQASCLPCSPGSANNVPGSKYCTLCKAELFSNITKLSKCYKCPVGKRALAAGSASCVNCVAGRYGTVCDQCPKGWFRGADDEDAKACDQCVAGRYTDKPGQAASLPCSPGKFSSEGGAASCELCSDGKFTFNTAQTVCENCKLGYGTVQHGSSFCSPCAKGKYGNEDSEGVCKDCPIAKYQDDDSETTCKNCPAGYITAGVGSAQCVEPQASELLNQPKPPVLASVPEKPRSVQISWEYESATEFKDVVPDGFTVRMSNFRDFSQLLDIKPTDTFVGGATRSVIVEMDAENSLWLVTKPIYLQVNAFLKCAFGDTPCRTETDKINGKPAKSEYSANTNPWLTADMCGEKEFLDTNHTDPTEWKCMDCPAGGACMGPTRWEDVRPLRGWWRVPWNVSIFKRCPFESDCIGYDVKRRKNNQTDIASDGCVLGTEGILCSQCSPGYNRDISVCTKCSAESLPIRVGIIVCVGIVLLVIFAFCRNNLKKKWRKYQPLYRDILRIVAITVTFSQINTSMPSIIDVPWPQNFVNFVANFNVVNIDLFSLIGVSCVGNFNFYLGFLAMSTMPLFIILWAISDLCTAKKSMINRVEKIEDQEKEMLLVESYHKLYHLADANGSGTINCVELSSVLKNVGWIVTPREAHFVIQHFHDDGSREWTDERGHVVLTEEEFVEAMLNGKFEESIHKQKIASSQSEKEEKSSHFLLSDPKKLIEWVMMQKIMSQSLAGATALAMLAHTPVSRKVFQFFHCNDISGRFFLRADYSIECWMPDWFAFLPIVLVVLGTFTLGLPAVLCYYLYSHRDRLYSISVQQKIGWMYDPYHKGVEFWQVHDVMLKMILTGLMIYVPSYARPSIASMVTVCAVASLNYFIPHKNRVLFWLTQLSFVTTVFKYLAALMIKVGSYGDDESSSPEGQALIGWLLIGLDISFMGSSLFCIMAAIYVVMKKIKVIDSRTTKLKAFARTVTNHTFSGVGAGTHFPDEDGMVVRSWGDNDKESKKKDAKSVKSTKVAPAASISISPDESAVSPS